ncbi:MAG: thioredoxin [Anaerolineae bacterium]|nr:thioredoxin [Anaerolineae bacterium]
MSSLQQVDDKSFSDVIETSEVPVLVDFFAEWCPPCRRLGPTLEEVAEELADRLKIVKVNVDSTSLAPKHGVMNIPTMILFKQGEEVDRLVGNQSKRNLIEQLEKHLD